MPTVPTAPAHDRCFAHVEAFSCACPSCGRVVRSNHDTTKAKRAAPARKWGTAATLKRAHRLTWNPYTQRLLCPWCQANFVVGLLIYPVGRSGQKHEPPPDSVPTRAERLELRRLGGGYVTKEDYRMGAPATQVVTAPCACPPGGWVSTCPVHGPVDPAVALQAEYDKALAENARLKKAQGPTPA